MTAKPNSALLLMSLAVWPLLLLLSANASALNKTEADYELKLLGKYIFFDNISNPKRMACVTCHDPATGWTGSVAGINLGQVAVTGANPHSVGNLKPPSNAYASLIPPFHFCGGGAPGIGGYCGGNFWNGRSEGRGDETDVIAYPPDAHSPLFPAGAAKHIGNEVFQGLPESYAWTKKGYVKYFGPTADQALNPMPNPVEQNIDRKGVCEHVAAAEYAELYELAWGVQLDCSDAPATVSAPDVNDFPEKAYDITFKRLMLSVGAWQHSAEVNSFSSKRDKALREELACVAAESDPSVAADPSVCNDPDYLNSKGTFPLVGLTAQENLGHDLFYNTRFNRPFPQLPVANCAACHSDNPRVDEGTELMQLYADDAYHNIGTPPNPAMTAAPATGLKDHTGAPPGFFKTPTLRNVDKRKGDGFPKAYTHNGWFKSLESIVHFYNTAAVKPRCPENITSEKDALANDCWPAPEFPGAAIPFFLGNLGLTAEQEAALVAYLKTFTDSVTPKAPPPYR